MESDNLDLGALVRSNLGTVLLALLSAGKRQLAADVAMAAGTTLAAYAVAAREELARRRKENN